jgi:alpha-methylacyl-CoA racemase
MDERKGPLTHLRVLELGGLAPVPYCGLILKQFGADVIHIQRLGVQPDDPANLDLGKRKLALDLKSKQGIEVLKRMCKNADVLIDPYRPGVLEKLGLDPNMLIEKINPRLIVARVTGWGQTGPLAQAAGHDQNYLSITGILSLFTRNGTHDRPIPPINILGDFAGGGMLAAMGILIALYERSKSGKGQIVDAAMVDGATHLASFIWRMRAAGAWKDGPNAQNVLDTSAPFYDVYTCSDGKFISVGAIEPQFYDLLLQGLNLAGDGDLPGSQFEKKLWPDNKRVIAGRIAMRTRDYWANVFRPDGPYRDACVAPILTMEEAPKHPHNVARGLFHQGITKTEQDLIPTPAPRLSRTPGIIHNYWRPLPIGANSRGVLMMYGFSADEVDELTKQGIVGVHDTNNNNSGGKKSSKL